MSTHSDFTDNGRYACVYNISQAQVWDVEKKRLLTKYVCNDLANPITAAALAQVFSSLSSIKRIHCS